MYTSLSIYIYIYIYMFIHVYMVGTPPETHILGFRA